MERHGLSFSIGALALTVGLAGFVPATAAGNARPTAPQAQARAGDQALRMFR